MKFLSLDPNYPNLIMLQKVAKALDEMAKNEELMAGILAAAEEDIGGAEIEGDGGQIIEEGKFTLFNTIGEDEDEKALDTNKSKGKERNEEDNYDDN